MKYATLSVALLCMLMPLLAGNSNYESQESFITLKHVPLFAGRTDNNLASATIFVDGQNNVLKSVIIHYKGSINTVSAINVLYSDSGKTGVKAVFGRSLRLRSVSDTGSRNELPGKVVINGKLRLTEGKNFLDLVFIGKQEFVPGSSFRITEVDFMVGDKKISLIPPEDYKFYPALVLRSAGQDNCNTYRIPGLATTNKGTLIAVYDKRYNSSRDLQEDIDVGMSRSTDGGKTWEPSKVIMDMGEWGGRPQNENGIGDPSVLVDNVTGAIWVAALWIHGNPGKTAWWNSKPGMSPEETGQLMLVRSDDDGVTWSAPVNITSQTKKPEWQFFFQGPGRGITMKNGVIVFPAQFKADIGIKAVDGGQYTPHSTIIYSNDHGKTWLTGTGAKSNTTEAQVVELSDGSLMLNMRDDRNRTDKGETNGRAVAITKDMGQTWALHSTSNSALPEPNCMASLISAEMKVSGSPKRVLLFSNPANKLSRTDMTIKASLDEGLTWPEKYQLRLNENRGDGYSCLTMIDENNIGILYEGNSELYFQVVPVREVVGKDPWSD
jgi:sialidase-1